jgi:hypothetical protein
VGARGAYFEGVTQCKYSQEIPFSRKRKEKDGRRFKKNEMLALAFCFWKHSPLVDEKLPSIRVPLDTLENFR